MFKILHFLLHELDEVRKDEQGATMLEWVLLVAAVILPSYVIIRYLFEVLVIWYQMITQINAFPIP